MPLKDEFGDRMKMYERFETSRSFLPGLPVYARIDGRSFSKFTKGMERPFDERMSRVMRDTTGMLVQETHALMGYTQSDEISLVWHAPDYNSEIFFAGKVQKMCSVLSAMATAQFMLHLIGEAMEEYWLKAPHFDCRVFQLPSTIEATNAFLWREKDARKNAISMAARHYYSHKELHGKNSREMLEMLEAKGVNFDDYPAYFKRGTFIRKENVTRHLTPAELSRIPENHRPTGPVIRSEIVELAMPKFHTVENREGVIFNGEYPINGIEGLDFT